MTAVLNDEFQQLVHRGFDCQSEVDLKCDLGLGLYSAVYEEGRYSNGFINVAKPWSIHVYWRLYGSLRDCICGEWCVRTHFESMGPGPEFNLEHAGIKFDCRDAYWHVRIPGQKIGKEDCASPYQLITTVTYRSLCDRPAPIVGTCKLPLITFYHSDR